MNPYRECYNIINADPWGFLKPMPLEELEWGADFLPTCVNFSYFTIGELNGVIAHVLCHNQKNSHIRICDISKEEQDSRTLSLSPDEQDNIHVKYRKCENEYIYWSILWGKFQSYCCKTAKQERKQKKEQKRLKKQKAYIYYQQKVKGLCAQRLNKNVAGIITSYLF